MAKVITAGAVNLIHPETIDLVTLVAGDVVPEWAEPLITNPALIADAPGDTTHVSHDATTAPASTAAVNITIVNPVDRDVLHEAFEASRSVVDGTVAELRARAKEVGVAQGGSKADLIARINAKLAADATSAVDPAGIAPDSPVGEPAGDTGTADLADTDRAALVARAEALNIAIDDELSDTELEALIEDAED